MDANFAADALDEAIALQKIRAYCENVLENDSRTSSTSWGEGYRQCELDFARGILLVINGEDS